MCVILIIHGDLRVLMKLQLRRRVDEHQVMCGCLDTWLLWQLTGRRVFATDYSNASVTMLFDPFQVNTEYFPHGLT